MEKVSTKLFFTVLWRGLCQALGWFLGLFGYKRDGKFARCLWGVFATSATVVMFLAAWSSVFEWWCEETPKWQCLHYYCDDRYCENNHWIENDIFFHSMDNGNGFVYNIRTGEKFLKHVACIEEPNGKDSLVCFSNGEKYGYFSENTGRLVIEAKYDHAWIFSDGLACVDEGGRIKFINAAGEVVIDKGMTYKTDMDGYVFHEGYCVVHSEDGKQRGLMDKTGKMVLPMEYKSIKVYSCAELWQVEKDGKKAVYNRRMELILPLMECCLNIDDGTIDVTMPDHTIRKYDYDGNLIHDFYVDGVRMLEYEKDEIKYEYTEIGDMENTEMKWEPCHPRATARLRAYSVGAGYEGLMTADGHVVTLPLYTGIVAIGYDLYLCRTTNNDMLIVNGEGEIVR